MNDTSFAKIDEIVSLLAAREYASIELVTASKRLLAEEIEGTILRYGRTIIEPPKNFHSMIDAIEIEGASPRSWSVVVPLWTAEEGRSDLSIELTIIEDSGSPRVELDNIRVR